MDNLANHFIKVKEKEKLIVEFTKDDNFKLKRDFCFIFASKDNIDSSLIDKSILIDRVCYKYIKIPCGFNTDFGSIPQIFQSFISPIGKPTKAYVLHDYLLYLHKIGKIKKRKTCDDTFKVALERLGVGKFKTNLIYFCVRLYSIFKKK